MRPLPAGTLIERQLVHLHRASSTATAGRGHLVQRRVGPLQVVFCLAKDQIRARLLLRSTSRIARHSPLRALERIFREVAPSQLEMLAMTKASSCLQDPVENLGISIAHAAMVNAVSSGAARRAVVRAGLCGDAGKTLVDEPHDHRSLADCGGATFDRAGPHVAGGVDPGTLVSSRPLGPGVGAGQHETLVVALRRRRRASRCTGSRRGTGTGTRATAARRRAA